MWTAQEIHSIELASGLGETNILTFHPTPKVGQQKAEQDDLEGH
jgi:hypothetical protein